MPLFSKQKKEQVPQNNKLAFTSQYVEQSKMDIGNFKFNLNIHGVFIYPSFLNCKDFEFYIFEFACCFVKR